jgi:hypothetical protein
MGYYIRILSKRPERMPFSELRGQMAKAMAGVELELEDGDETGWAQVLVKHDGADVCELTCDLDGGDDSLVREEAAEFVDEIQGEKPASAVQWLSKYLEQVRSIYAFRILGGDDVDWDVVGAAKEVVFSWAGGIIQADGEGFSNESGYHILWQFSAQVTGEWHMAVLDANGRWVTYAMDLGKAEHREAFFRGEVPKGVKATPET